jgi:NitT/TauT family transport system permease protein
MREAAKLYRFSWWQSFTQMELPYAVIGLVWNSMMSVAGGWFFLLACERFILGNRDFRLPGLGAYRLTAADAGDTRAILWGVAAMLVVIILSDQLVWRPLIAWAEKFKIENVEATDVPRSPILDLLRHSRLIGFLSRKTVTPVKEALLLHFGHRDTEHSPDREKASPFGSWLLRLLGVALLAGIAYAVFKAVVLLSGLHGEEVKSVVTGAVATFLRITLTLILGALWTIPVGVAIGSHPRLARIAQPIAQIAASVPATALFPVVLLALVHVGGGLGIGSIVLLLLGTQWYILFNVIAGATSIPTDLKEVCNIFSFSNFERWRKLILPGIFPFLITGLVTASGGAWNASIVAEYFHFKGQTFSTTGLGAVISQATDSGNFDLLLAATLCMAAIVVTINRLLWRRMYRLAASRFKLET